MNPLNMRPGFSINGIANSSHSNIKKFCDFTLGQNSSKRPNFENISIVQLRRSTAFTKALATLFHHVLNIIIASSKKEVLGVNAGRIVARMENPKTIRNLTKNKKPSDSMTLEPNLFIVPPEEKTSIPGSLKIFPFSAFVRSGLVNLRPEAFDFLDGHWRNCVNGKRHTRNLFSVDVRAAWEVAFPAARSIFTGTQAVSI